MGQLRGRALSLVLVHAGPLDAPSGGSRYHKRLVETLRARGVAVHALELPGPWPRGQAQLAAERDRFSGCTWLVDGLLYPALVDQLPPSTTVLHHLPLRYEWPELDSWEQGALDRAARIVCTSPWAAADLDRPAHVVVPGTDRSNQVRRPIRGRVLGVGTVCPRKDQLSFSSPGVVLAGRAEGPYAAACSDAGAELLGPLGPAALDREYAHADLFAQASSWETWGMALCEALVRGVPVVARDLPAVRYLAPHAAVDDVAATVPRLLAAPAALADLAMASRAAGARLPTWHEQATRLLEVLELGPDTMSP